MVGRVADQMDQRIAQRFGYLLVDFGFFAEDLQVDLFVLRLGNIADDAREPLEDGFHRDHTHGHGVVLDHAGDPVDSLNGRFEQAQIVLMVVLELEENVRKGVSRDDQLPGQVDVVI